MLLGPPAGGKGTQAGYLAERYGTLAPVFAPQKNGAFKPSVARNFWDFLSIYLYWITKLWNVDKIWLNLFLHTLHGPTPAPQDEWTPTLKMEKRHQLSSGQISTWVSRWDEFFPGMIHISMGDLLRARAKFLPQLAEYISQGKLVGGLVGLQHVWMMETSEQQLQWGLARILVTEHDFMILLRLPGAGWCGGFSFEGVVMLT